MQWQSSMRYNIHLGVDCPSSELATIISQYFKGATISRGQGLWQGKLEPSYTITLIVDGDDALQVHKLATKLKTFYRQQAVLVTREVLQSKLEGA